MGNLRVSNEVILAKLETTYNVDAAPTAGTNAILVQNLQFDGTPLRMVKRPAIRADIGQLQDVFAGQLAKIKFETEVKGSGSAGTAPEIDPLLQACAMSSTIVASTSVTYKPLSTGMLSVTIYWYEGGRKLHKLTGAVGTCSLKMTAGGLALFSFEFTGHYTNPTDQSEPSPTYNTHVPAPAINMAFTLNSVSGLIIREFMCDLKNKIATPPSIAATDGYGMVQVVQHDVGGEITMDAELAATIDVDGLLSGGTAFQIVSGTLGAVAGNKFTATSSTNAYFRARAVADTDGMRTRRMTYGVQESALGANDEIAYAFT